MRFVTNLKVFITGRATHDWKVDDSEDKLHGMQVEVRMSSSFEVTVHVLIELDLKTTFLLIRS